MNYKPGFPPGILIDPEDEHLASRRWRWSGDCYIMAGTTADERAIGLAREEYLHRIIMRPPKGMVVDHISRDVMDNRRQNLRVITQAENCRNVSIRSDCSSGYRGVRWCSVHKTWRAYGSVNRKQYHIGYFKDAASAGAAARAWRITNMPGAVD